MLWISILAVVVAAGSTIVGYLVLRSQVDPQVIVYSMMDRRRPSIVLLVVENIGKGSARNIRFTSSKPLPQHAFGIREEQVGPFEPMQEGALIKGIPFLEPGGKRVFTWGQYGGLKRHLGEQGVSVTATYQHRHLGWPFYVRNCETFPLEIASFAREDIADLNWDEKAADHLKDIAAALNSAVRMIGPAMNAIQCAMAKREASGQGHSLPGRQPDSADGPNEAA